jgi:surface antigen
MRKVSWLLIPAMLFMLASCADPGASSKGVQGAAFGAIGGALLGQAIGRTHQATLVGAALGTMLGYIVGNEMDKYDRQHLNYAYENGPSGQATTWHNPDTGNTYQVTPQPAYYPPTQPDRPCRQAEILATIDGKTQKTYTTACRDQDGRWILQNR